MANSLHEQLLKAGLVDEKKLKQARHASPKKKKKGKGKAAAEPAQPSAAEEARRREAERSRELNRQQKEAAERKALEAQIRQLIDTHRQDREGGEIAYNFQHGKLIRHLHVTPEQRDRLGNGRMAIVALEDGYEVVTREGADKIAERDADRVVVCNDPDPRDKAKDEDDPYAGYEIPDDLMW
ncbi:MULTISPECIES: DUF2058 domain-containing protein [Ectothiorhodospira]|uniref:DUF2058 domain-containing protein n=1 Tax=Ectothiorhodospira TaxID=1051 RepID=UPI001EE7FF9A|nr:MULTISPECIES: DUF2058 domain-containing protein [Ectothiorhodospira]MCG5495585.1 DUF2058 domain-containing protein [Ectothiorhodospira variabilis]MCG5498377.1 DUF2058 domain-containing protein [Ectothiorhodospira variabilis]MCG5503053.1 DUF2058 domain-containing protein [Ectothiorhodospira variabilis]MCG5506188.1 DUF2058 domain-containing protein [Ectothiorhodospira variabilis]MCG5524051.1 DUF2058 domain-containing protein [Ectothiorhodospira haloalkaliphila]